MKIAEMNWMQVAEYLKRDDRAVIPLGSVEQHCYQSLATDLILTERLAVEATSRWVFPYSPVWPTASCRTSWHSPAR